MDKCYNKCDYCGENKPMKTIPNPNFNENDYWEVCLTCDEVIKEQEKLSFGAILSERPLGKKYGDKLMIEANKRLREISHEADIPILSVCFHGNKEGPIK